MNEFNTNSFNVAIIINDNFLETWKVSIIKKIKEIQSIDEVYVFSRGEWSNNNAQSMYPQPAYMMNIEEKLFDISYNALNLVNISGIDIGEMNIKYTKLEDVRERNFSIAIDLSGNLNSDDIYHIPKYGIWRFFFGEISNENYVKSIQDNYFNNVGFLNVGIVSEVNKEKFRVLYDKKTGLDNVSMTISSENVLWGAVEIVPRLICGILENKYTNSLYEFSLPRRNKKISHSPKTSMMQDLHCFKKYAKQAVIRYGMSCNWVLLLSIEKEKNNNEKYKEINEFKKIIPPKGHFWADPFVVENEGSFYVFFEELSYQYNKGYIRYIRINSDGEYSKPVTVLEKPYHLSYPFIFRYSNEYYMIPETGENKTIELYRCVSFPDKWEYVKNLSENIMAYDTTLVKHDGRWWMFTCEAPHENCMTSEELHIYYADDPLSDNWTPHKQNPVIVDVTRARPAGEFFQRNGKLYRPSQNNAGIYGKGLNINEVIELTPDSYKEETIHADVAQWSHSIEGIHTYNQSKNVVVSDAQYYQRLRSFA